MYNTFHVKKGKKSTCTNNTTDSARIHICLNKYMENDLEGHTTNTQEWGTTRREGD